LLVVGFIDQLLYLHYGLKAAEIEKKTRQQTKDKKLLTFTLYPTTNNQQPLSTNQQLSPPCVN
jgi:hypothetical protein